MKLLFTVLCCLCILSLQAQSLTNEQREEIESAILALDEQEQEAFKAGDCDKVISFFHPELQFYARGRKMPNREFIGDFCQRIPRPFPETGTIKDEVHVLTPEVAYMVRTIDLPAQGAGQEMREVITKVWQKNDEEWKIVHFHSSVSPVGSAAQGRK